MEKAPRAIPNSTKEVESSNANTGYNDNRKGQAACAKQQPVPHHTTKQAWCDTLAESKPVDHLHGRMQEEYLASGYRLLTSQVQNKQCSDTLLTESMRMALRTPQLTK